MTRFDLDAYLERIGFLGTPEPTIETLHTLHLLHPQVIAFENLDPFLGRPVRLDLEALQDKLVRGGRGGYCFEHNLLFMHALREIGFAVTGLAARVLWNHPVDAITARGHMLLRVEIDGASHIADVGFGALTQTAPLLLEPGIEQATPHETFRIVETGDHLRVQAEAGGQWRTLYRFDLAEQFEIDYAVTSYYLSTHPSSHFVTGLAAARPVPGMRYALSGNRFTVRHLGGSSETAKLETASRLIDALEAQFGLAVPDREAFTARVTELGIVPPAG